MMVDERLLPSMQCTSTRPPRALDSAMKADVSAPRENEILFSWERHRGRVTEVRAIVRGGEGVGEQGWHTSKMLEHVLGWRVNQWQRLVDKLVRERVGTARSCRVDNVRDAILLEHLEVAGTGLAAYVEAGNHHVHGIRHDLAPADKISGSRRKRGNANGREFPLEFARNTPDGQVASCNPRARWHSTLGQWPLGPESTNPDPTQTFKIDCKRAFG
jgi:hypothetical protein